MTDRADRSLYLDQLRRDLTTYGMHQRMPGATAAARLRLKSTNIFQSHAHGYIKNESGVLRQSCAPLV